MRCLLGASYLLMHFATYIADLLELVANAVCVTMSRGAGGRGQRADNIPHCHPLSLLFVSSLVFVRFYLLRTEKKVE
ncbi:hypothetical protein GGR50DRAFT_665588 [Xylaria sp. CBS 124048]|nr:hypothetical protein GGR50DRAFT_665588 [Xylaria sp. CBS 124048]